MVEVRRLTLYVLRFGTIREYIRSGLRFNHSFRILGAGLRGPVRDFLEERSKKPSIAEGLV